VTLPLRAGVPLATLQRILRRTDPEITADVYGHLDLDDMRAGRSHLELGSPSPEIGAQLPEGPVIGRRDAGCSC
jgi:hypothetical protein